MSITIKTINQAGTAIETGFNVAGCIPIVGFVSGSLRAGLGKVQAVAGLVLMAVGGLGQLFADDNTRVHRRFEKVFQLGAEHTIHGVLNIIRGSAEAFTCAAFFGVGNLMFLIPNLAQNDIFEPFVFKYGAIIRA